MRVTTGSASSCRASRPPCRRRHRALSGTASSATHKRTEANPSIGRRAPAVMEAILAAAMAPALRGGEFMSNWNTLPLSELLERIYGTMPLNAPKSLSRGQAVDVVAFLLKSGGFPAGAPELGPETAALQEIAFVAMKP